MCHLQCYLSTMDLRLTTDSGFLCMQCLAVLIIVLFGFMFYENCELRKICKCRICNIWLMLVYPSFCALCITFPNWIIPISSLSPSVRTCILIQGFFFSCLQTSSLSNWSRIVVVQVPPWVPPWWCTPGVGHLQPDSGFIYTQVEPKQNIDFSGVSHDLHLCNEIVSATNIQFFFCSMEIGFFMWE